MKRWVLYNHHHRRSALRSRPLALIVAPLFLACAAPANSVAPGPRSPTGPVVVPRTVVTPDAATSVPELYAEAVHLAERGEHARAALAFERVVKLDPNGDLADDALFHAAAEHDESAELEVAAGTYEQVARRFPQSPLALSAIVRATRIFTYLERWDRAGELASRALLSSSSLGAFDAVLIYGASALYRLSLDDEASAATFIEKGRQVIDTHALDAAGTLPRELATLYFALGELRRRRADRIVFQPVPPNFAEVLEQRCQLLLDAQSAYSDTMRAHDAHWSAMAGFRVGELYQRLHEDLMRVTPPLGADSDEKRKLFEGAMRLRYSILLSKALGMMQHTLSMAERTNERSSWVERAETSRRQIEAAIAREQAALDALPYSRATLQAALEDVGRRARAKESVKGAPPKAVPAGK